MPPKSAKRNFASKEAIELIVYVLHPRRAFNSIISEEPDNFDAPYGDATCHARPPAVSHCSEIFSEHLAKTGKAEEARRLIKEFEDLHKNDKAESKAREASDFVNGGKGSEAYEALFEEMTGLLYVPDHWKLVHLSYSKTIDNTKCFTIYGTYYSKRGTTLYAYSTDLAEQTKKASDRIDMDSQIKSELGTANLAYLTWSLDSQRLIGTLHDDLVKAIKDPGYLSPVILKNGFSYEVLDVFNIFMATLTLDYKARRPFTISARHLSADGQIGWNGTEVLYFVPNDEGTWTYVPDEKVDEQQHKRFGSYYNMWHTSTRGSNGKGFYSDNFEEFVEMLRSSDFSPEWWIAKYGAVHPTFAGVAEREKFEKEEALTEYSKTIAEKHKFDQFHCDGLRFDVQTPGDNHIGLDDLWACAYQAGQEIKNGHEYGNVPDLGNARLFINDPYPLAVNHVQCRTYGQVKALVASQWAKYQEAGCPKLGRWLVRYSDTAIYCDSLQEAQEVDKMKTVKQREFIEKQGLSALYK